MGCCVKLIDTFLVFYMALIAIGAPTLDAQVIIPTELYPEFLVKINLWYVQMFGDYLFEEKPNFFIGIIWLELLFNWPLVIASLYGILARKAWFPSTLLITGVSIFTTLAPIVADMVLSGKASNRLLFAYGTVAAFSIFAILRASVAFCDQLYGHRIGCCSGMGDAKAGTVAVGRKLGSKDKKKA